MTRSARRKLGAALVAFALLLAVAGPALAGHFQATNTSCSSYMTTNSLCFKEDTNGGGEEVYVLQGANIVVGNLGNIDVNTGDGTCAGGIFNNGSWNDCVSWVRWNIASGYRACAYRDSSLTGPLLWSRIGPSNSQGYFNGSTNDNITSFVIVSGTGCP